MYVVVWCIYEQSHFDRLTTNTLVGMLSGGATISRVEDIRNILAQIQYVPRIVEMMQTTAGQ